MAWDQSNMLHCEIIAFVRQRKKRSVKYNKSKGGVMSLSEKKRDALLKKYNLQQAVEFVRHRLSLYITSDANNLNVICQTIFLNDETTARFMAVRLMDELSYQYEPILFDPYGYETSKYQDQLDWDSNEVSYRDPTSLQWRVR